jgi:glycerophosphoryl diester phosphodiesterase
MVVHQWLSKQPIAHRGLHKGAQIPENSLAAFRSAIDEGYAIELDVQLTADGRIAVFHDYDLARMTGRESKLSQLTWAQIKELQLLGSQHKIPLFSEVLDLVAAKVPILIEIKNEGAVGGLEATLANILDRYSGAFAIQSFNPFSVKWFKNNRPDFTRGQLAGDYRDRPDIKGIKKYLLKNMWFNLITNPSFIAYDIRAGDEAFFSLMKQRANVPLLLWTIDSLEKQAQCRKLGANIIFEGFSPS